MQGVVSNSIQRYVHFQELMGDMPFTDSAQGLGSLIANPIMLLSVIPVVLVGTSLLEAAIWYYMNADETEVRERDAC